MGMPTQSSPDGSVTVDAELNPVPKVPTRVQGLDEVLHGGIPRARTTLVSGGPGSGKTVLATEFLYRAALEGEPGIYISFEEPAEAIRRNALSLGWDLAALEEAGRLLIIDARIDPRAVWSGEFDIAGLLTILGRQAEAMGATYLAVDAIDALLRPLEDPRREREQLEALHRWLLDHEFTAVLTVKASHNGARNGHYEFLDYMVDCLLMLDQRVTGQVSTRRLRVVKYRGSGYERNEHPFAITTGGIKLLPLSGGRQAAGANAEIVETGIDGLDEMLGGGLYRGSMVLITGAGGTGKTSLTSALAREACRRGQRVLYVQFEESAEMMIMRMRSPGIDLQPAIDQGLLRIEDVDYQTALDSSIFITPGLLVDGGDRRLTVFGNLNDTARVLSALGLQESENG